MKLVKKITLTILSTAFLLSLTACTPEIGSEAWCGDMKAKPKADWTAQQASDFAKSCIFK
ncbi:MAG: DUF3012 domain-containing protein [Cycloclasticus sp.]|jgi:hypothetical protein|nr:MAG: hypothetical protein AXW16_00605 [Cycloclasticus sp. Phe_18]MBV1913078.1 DUF3012 domain-containing protein [Cycloclasticus sp.]MDF1689945.1 DUF3012 domain-containing protein [Cycloclasticus sp.]MEE4291755.1 DUF3012 domain-containing protein [Cycloclasticus sp.]